MTHASAQVPVVGVHPYAEQFPMMPEPELAEMTESVRVDGLQMPLDVTPEGMVLDGRNRLEACRRAGVTPTVRVVPDGTDYAAFVIAANVLRRHMTTGARAMATALVLAADGRRQDNGRWRRGSARVGGTSEIDSAWELALKHAGTVLDHAPHLAAQVRDGDLALDAAYKQATAARDAARDALAEQDRIVQEETEARAALESSAPEYLTQIGPEGRWSSARVAHAAWEDANRAEAARLRREREVREKKERDEQQSWARTYGNIADAIRVLASWDYLPAEKVMERYDPRYLHPPQLSQYLEVDQLNAAANTAAGLAEWRRETA